MAADNFFENRLENGTLHLSEWESLKIGSPGNVEEIRRYLGSLEEKPKEIELTDFFEPRIKASCHVGAMAFDPPIECSTGPLRQVIVTPKICDSGGGWPDFLLMLEVAYDIKLPKLKKEKTELGRIKDLRLILALIYARAAEELLKKHLRRNYVIRVDRLNGRVKGKLLLTPYIRQQVARGQPQIAVCQYYELTPDTPLNRIVKAGLRSAKRLVASADCAGWDHLSGALNRSLGLMGYVEDVRITRADCARVRLHAQNRYYETAFKLAQLLLFGNRFEYLSGETGISGFFLDMNDLFERFVLGLLKRNNLEVDYQYGLKYSVDQTDSRYMLPDYRIQTDSSDIIGDAKYKEIFENTNRISDDETVVKTDLGSGLTVRISNSDIYQMVAYLDNAGVNNGVLFYPAMEDIGVPKLVTGFREKEIKIIGIDLSDINALIDNKIAIIEET